MMGGIVWRIRTVSPKSDYLVDRTGNRTVATTDPVTHCIYLSHELSGSFLFRVVVHEMGHAAMISFGLLDDIWRMVRPSCWIEAEEWICNFIADYGLLIFEEAYGIVGVEALRIVPKEMERLIA